MQPNHTVKDLVPKHQLNVDVDDEVSQQEDRTGISNNESNQIAILFREEKD